MKGCKDPPELLYKTGLLNKGKTKNGFRKLFLTVRCVRAVRSVKKKKQSACNIKNRTKMEKPWKYSTSESTEQVRAQKNKQAQLQLCLLHTNLNDRGDIFLNNLTH